MKKEKLNIVYEDKYLIVINKPSGMLTISNEKEKNNTLYHQVSLYLKKQNKNNKVFIVHRLDKDTSGLVLLAKSEKIKRMLQDNWANVQRGYTAIVKGKVEKDKDTLTSYLMTTKTHYVYSTKNKKGKLAITEYERINSNNLYSALKINIKTGRRNQIRVQLKDINHPIIGDKTYNEEKDKHIKRLCLHANYLEFTHPITHEVLKLSIDDPKDFKKLINY